MIMLAAAKGGIQAVSGRLARSAGGEILRISFAEAAFAVWRAWPSAVIDGTKRRFLPAFV
jgi:hypothetical protein